MEHILKKNTKYNFNCSKYDQVLCLAIVYFYWMHILSKPFVKNSVKYLLQIYRMKALNLFLWITHRGKSQTVRFCLYAKSRLTVQRNINTKVNSYNVDHSIFSDSTQLLPYLCISISWNFEMFQLISNSQVALIRIPTSYSLQRTIQNIG